MFSIYICEYCLHEYSCEGSPSGCPNCGGTSTLIARDDGPSGEMAENAIRCFQCGWWIEPEDIYHDKDGNGDEILVCESCHNEEMGRMKTKVSEPDKPAIPWCEEHQCEFELTFRDPPGYEFYACPECERERGEALDLR